MGSIHVPKRFAIWSRIEGVELPGKSGRRNARLWPVHEHREVDAWVMRRCGVEHGFEGVVVGLTFECDTGKLAGLMIREREPTRLTAATELELDRVLGLRDPVYHRLLVGTHAGIDNAILESLGAAAARVPASSLRATVTALGRFVERRRISLEAVERMLEAADAGSLIDSLERSSRRTVG